MQEEGRVMELKDFFVQMFSAVEDRGELGGAKCDLIRHADCG